MSSGSSSGSGKRSAPAGEVNPPRAKKAKKKKKPVKRRLIRKAADAVQLQFDKDYQDLFPPSLLAQKAPPLKSFFLAWKCEGRPMHDRLRALSNESLIKAFKKEIKIFVHMKMTDQIATSIREALVSLPRDSNETASFAAETDPVALKREWINKLVKQINDLRKPKKAKAPVPDQFDEVLESLEKSEAEKRVPDPHPRGTGELAPPPLGGDDSFSSSSGEDNSEDSDERSDEDEGRQHGTQKRSEGQQKYNESPLATDPAVQGHLRRIKGLKKVQDLDLRTVDWITDLFSNNSNHIRRVVDGTHRDVNWARQEFKHACVYILSLWQKVRDREEAGDALAAKTKATTLCDCSP